MRVQWLPESYTSIVAVVAESPAVSFLNGAGPVTSQTPVAAPLARAPVSELDATDLPAHPEPLVHGRGDGAHPGRGRTHSGRGAHLSARSALGLAWRLAQARGEPGARAGSRGAGRNQPADTRRRAARG